MTHPTPWLLAAGRLAAQAAAELESPDQLTRMAAETKAALARADLKRAMAAVAHLAACLELEPAA